MRIIGELNQTRYSHNGRKPLDTKLPRRNQPPKNQSKQVEGNSFQSVLDKEINNASI